jgi:hypothetical protein
MQHKIEINGTPTQSAISTRVFFASRNSPLLQNIFPSTGGEN